MFQSYIGCDFIVIQYYKNQSGFDIASFLLPLWSLEQPELQSEFAILAYGRYWLLLLLSYDSAYKMLAALPFCRFVIQADAF